MPIELKKSYYFEILTLSMVLFSPFTNTLKSNVKKRLYLNSMLVFAVFFSSTFFVHEAFAAGTPGCGFFEFSQECDLSGWLHLIIGDMVIGALLALLFHHLSHRTQNKLETIIESQEVLRIRRKDYAVQHLKNLFNTLLFTIGIINKSTSNFNEALGSETRREERLWIRGIMLSELRSDEAKMGRVLLSIRNNIMATNDVLEPEITNQIDGICTFIGELSFKEHQDGTMVYPKYNVCKTKIKLMLEKLQTYTHTTHSFQEPKTEDSQNVYEEYSKTLKKPSKTIIIPGDIR